MGRAAVDALLERVDGELISAWDALIKRDTRAARRRLSAAGGRVELRGDGLELLDESPPPACVVKSPGLHPTVPLLAEASRRGIPVLDESELGWRLENRPVIGITGTNGSPRSPIWRAGFCAGIPPLRCWAATRSTARR